jgi:PAS domain S-box-containing protein
MQDIGPNGIAHNPLLESEHFMQTVISSVQEGLIVFDRDLRYRIWNPFMEKLTGVKSESLIGTVEPNAFPHSKDLGIDDLFHRALSGEVVHSADMKFNVPGTEKTVWFAATFGPHRTLDGTIIGVVGTVLDISDRKRAEASLAAERERQNQKSLDNMIKTEKLESIGILAGGIAHDFNNLLGGVFGYISLARDYVTGNDKAFMFLSKALNAFHRAGDLTKQLLTFSKGGSPVKKTYNLEPIIKEMAQFALSGSNARCTFSISKNLPMCDIDKNQIGQVIDNIIINAKQAMPNGGEISISIEPYSVKNDTSLPLAHGEYVRISIKDQGTGIAKEHFSKIFDPFFTTKPKGTGLGLATSFSIIQRHDGFIDVDSEIGKGSTFILYLPVSKSPITPEQQADLLEMKGKGRILVMDGEDFIREITREMLKVMGYDTVLADSGDEALSLVKDSIAEQKPFDAVILDLTIAGSMGGMETAKVLRAIDPAIKAIVSSGYANDPVMADPATYGFLDKLKKPFLKEDLANVLYRVLSHAT